MDYILELIFNRHKKTKDKSALVDEVRRMIRSSIGNRVKESLIVETMKLCSAPRRFTPSLFSAKE